MKRTTLVAVAVCLVLVTAGCSAFQSSDSSPGTDTPEPTTSMSTSTTPGQETPNQGTSTSTTTPNTSEQEMNYTGYTADFIRLLESDSVDISALNASYNGSKYDGSSINFKSASLEAYGDGNQERLLVNISSPNEQNLRRAMNATFLLYAHVLETAHRNGDTPTFDEVVIYPHQDDEVAARLHINEYMMMWHLEGWQSPAWVLTEYTLRTTGLYRNGSFTAGASPELRERIYGATTANGTVLRVEQVGGLVFVDYATTTDPDNGARRTAEIAKIVYSYGQTVANENLNYDSYDIIIEERHVTENGTHDLRGWTTVHTTDARDYAQGQMSAEEILNIIVNRYLYEDGYLGR